ncbi:RelA/SpoT domain-containing protein [Prosthecobacter sp.]|uniref:RelA/SpoT domain-containing protein n=1 Tax=Prosthecobacter sp. TaxID=1965333 RepID=UPI00378451A7
MLMKNSTVYSGKDIARAGAVLAKPDIAETDPSAFENAMATLSYWRACHEEPLNLAVELLSQCSQRHDKRAVIAKRLKRTPSIINKLCRFEGMSLKNMQDIGGCRAIVSSEKRVRKVVRELTKHKEFRIKDYISKPKADGYRSIHLIGSFSKNKGAPRSIELQVRTAAQHSWATAVEIIDLFTGQAIKASRGTKEWSTFFRCAGEQIALIEDIHLFNQLSNEVLVEEIIHKFNDKSVPDRHKAVTTNAATLYSLGKNLGILEHFNARAFSLKLADDHFTKVATKGYFLLEINLEKHEIQSRHFPEDKFQAGVEAYLAAEKQAAIVKELVVALVSTDALGGITEAYPNYFADSSLFTKYIAASIEAYQRYMPNAIYRIYKKIFG